MRVAGRDEGERIAPRRRPVGRVRAAVLQAEVGEPGVAERQADVAGEPGRLPVAGAVHSGVDLDGAAAAGVLELEVQHPGDRVRAVLRCRTVAQHFDLAQRNGGDGGDVGTLRAERNAVAAVPVDDRGTVAALAVDEDQRVVRGEIAQHGGADQRRAAADRLAVHAERRGEGAKLVLQAARAPPDEVGGRQDVHGDGRLGGAPGLRAEADDHRLLRESREQVPHLRGRQPQGLDLGRRHAEHATQFLDQIVRRIRRPLLRIVVVRLRARGGQLRRPGRHQHGQEQEDSPPRVSRS